MSQVEWTAYDKWMDVLGGEGMMRMTVLMNHDALTRGGASDLCKVHSTQVTSNAQDSYPSIIRVDFEEYLKLDKIATIEADPDRLKRDQESIETVKRSFCRGKGSNCRSTNYHSSYNFYGATALAIGHR